MANVPDGVPFIWAQAEKRLEAQIRQADALDTKASVLVGLHAIAAGVVASTGSRLSPMSRWVAVVVVVGLAITGVLAFAAFRTQAYDRSPSVSNLWRFGEFEETEIQYRFLSVRLDALSRNSEKLEAKARLLSRSLLGVAVLALIVAGAAIIGLVRSP